ncbi:hypothetical protein [Luteimonas sp. 100069]|uniref:Histidine kinase n=2 Tax=Luteimonas chenhongjianii TaxID=2006110 RepID=A0A290XBI7_9GAMM|nr:hypothetical protein [Luteimonas sp. 100069]ATD66348.1 hypothetical protein CNR27_01880 [Luteimonas chenhongjianii]RPD85411.1 hypothetical protein EGK76_10980 [Luteimonas sp. 100069]
MDTQEREWMHDLRNAANAVGISVTLGRRLVADGDHVRALEALDRAEVALVRIRDLLRGSAHRPAEPPRE